MKLVRKGLRGLQLLAVLALLLSTFPVRSDVPTTEAATGSLVGSVTFSVDCPPTVGELGLGVGIAYDGTNLWYSCYDPAGVGAADLHRANPITGIVNASYDIVPGGGLGALSYDATRNVIWAGEGGGGPAGEPIYKITLDGGKNVTGSSIEANVADVGFCDPDLDDGLAFDANGAGPADDVIYYSNDCGTTIIRAYNVSAFPLAVRSEPDFAWAGLGCYNSGLAVGGALLYEGADGCSTVYAVDKVTKLLGFSFSTVVPSDPNFRDEDLECDTNTFAVDVMWSKEAYSPMRAHAFEIPEGSCGIGGVPIPTSLEVTKTATQEGNLVVGVISITNVGEGVAAISGIVDSLEVHFRANVTPLGCVLGSTPDWCVALVTQLAPPGPIPVGGTVEIEYELDLCEAGLIEGGNARLNAMRNVVVVTLVNRPGGVDPNFLTRSESFKPVPPGSC